MGIVHRSAEPSSFYSLLPDHKMPHSFGYRARTRKLFAQPFRKHGAVSLAKYLTTYKVGDYVDIKANASIHKGMPFKFYHGRTGVIWNVTPRAVGVEINKQVRNRIIKKRIHVRIEHIQPSRCTSRGCPPSPSPAGLSRLRPLPPPPLPPSSTSFLCKSSLPMDKRTTSP